MPSALYVVNVSYAMIGDVSEVSCDDTGPLWRVGERVLVHKLLSLLGRPLATSTVSLSSLGAFLLAFLSQNIFMRPLDPE